MNNTSNWKMRWDPLRWSHSNLEGSFTTHCRIGPQLLAVPSTATSKDLSKMTKGWGHFIEDVEWCISHHIMSIHLACPIQPLYHINGMLLDPEVAPWPHRFVRMCIYGPAIQGKMCSFYWFMGFNVPLERGYRLGPANIVLCLNLKYWGTRARLGPQIMSRQQDPYTYRNSDWRSKLRPWLN